MNKVFVIVTVLMLIAPAMATVTISSSIGYGNDVNKVTIRFTSDVTSILLLLAVVLSYGQQI